MKKIWFENIFGAEGAENIYKPDLFHDFQLGYHTTNIQKLTVIKG